MICEGEDQICCPKETIWDRYQIDTGCNRIIVGKGEMGEKKRKNREKRERMEEGYQILFIQGCLEYTV